MKIGKYSIFSSFAFSLAMTVVPASVYASDYAIDSSHSHVGFTVRHLVSKVPGEFKDFEGTFSFDPKKPEKAKGEFQIKADSISTNNEKRDGHLKGEDFFNVSKFKTITFKSKKMTLDSENKYKLEGDMSMHGVTQPVVFNVEFAGTAKDPWGNNRAGFTATTRLKRKDFGIVYNKTLETGGLLIGDDVDVTLNIEAIEKK